MSIELAREIVRQGEVRLAALTTLATAADLRATTLCGIFGASAIGIGAATLAYFTTTHTESGLILGGAAAACGLFCAALVAARAGAPSDFWLGGGSPDLLRQWAWNNGEWRGELEMLEATAQRHAESINKNGTASRGSAKRLVLSLLIAFASPALGATIVLGPHARTLITRLF
jgi:hypothetical protein